MGRYKQLMRATWIVLIHFLGVMIHVTILIEILFPNRAVQLFYEQIIASKYYKLYLSSILNSDAVISIVAI